MDDRAHAATPQEASLSSRRGRVTAAVLAVWAGSLGGLQSATTPLYAQAIPAAQGVPAAGSLPPAAGLADVAPADQHREVNAALARRGTVIFRDTPMNEVLFTLGEQWGINIVAGSNVTGLASGVFRDATLHEILDAILTVNGYGYRHHGGSLVVLKAEEIGPGNPNLRAESLLLPESLSGEAMAEIVSVLTVLSSPRIGKVQPVPSASRIIVYDTPEQIAQMRSVLAKLLGPAAADPYAAQLPSPLLPGAGVLPGGGMLPGVGSLPGDTLLKIRPQYVPVTELAAAVELAVGGEASFVALEGEQVILLSGTPEAIRRASYAAAQVDVPRTQVRITAYIYDVSLGELERLGVDWSSQTMSQGVDVNGVPRNNIRMDGGLLGRSPAPLPVTTPEAVAAGATGGATGGASTAAAAAPAGGQWFFRTLSNNWELSTVIQALDETKGAKLLADPHVTVVDRETASIDIITKIPIQQLTQTQQGGAIGTTAFEEAGIKLNVTPRIAGDGTVEMIVEPEFSTLTGFQNGNPIIDARRARTTVRVADRHTLVIGGLRQKTAVETVRGIPGLMNVKFIGRLFRTHNTEMAESELICFLQPEIVDFCSAALPREEIAMSQQRQELSTIPIACPGPHVPDCRDPHCPHHHPRPRQNPGMPDAGLVSPHPLEFLYPQGGGEFARPAVYSTEPPIYSTEPPAFHAEPFPSATQPLALPPESYPPPQTSPAVQDAASTIRFPTAVPTFTPTFTPATFATAAYQQPPPQQPLAQQPPAPQPEPPAAPPRSLPPTSRPQGQPHVFAPTAEAASAGVWLSAPRAP